MWYSYHSLWSLLIFGFCTQLMVIFILVCSINSFSFSGKKNISRLVLLQYVQLYHFFTNSLSFFFLLFLSVTFTFLVFLSLLYVISSCKYYIKKHSLLVLFYVNHMLLVLVLFPFIFILFSVLSCSFQNLVNSTRVRHNWSWWALHLLCLMKVL